jgi:hypothetical protein
VADVVRPAEIGSVALMRNDWLHGFARNVRSQYGEDGILQKALETIGEHDRWCVEFGASNGVQHSCTFDLVTSHGYSAIWIEPDPERFQQLRLLFGKNPNVTALQRAVGWSRDDALDVILADTAVPPAFDLLVIDVDGNDYHVWEAVQQYRPKIVCIEFNPTIGNEVEFVQERDPDVAHGSSVRSICQLAKRKEYELVAVTEVNAIFVGARYFPLFGIQDNSLAALRPDPTSVLHLFTGYDGTTFIRGNRQLPWHRGLKYDARRLQQLPRILRRFPGRYTAVQRWLFERFRAWRRLRR